MAGLEGQTLGDCRIIKRLGAGGMGQVYLAEQMRLSRQVAVKVVRPPRSDPDDGGAPALADAPERFKLEARSIAALEHPNILPVHEFGTERDLMYLVMPLMPDGSLYDAMRPGSPRRHLHLPLKAADAAPIIFQAASALEYAHRHNVIHRDVKPENFLVRYDRDGKLELFLADFGLVKEYHPGSNTNTLAVGTADYVAPEQIEGHPVPASDQYSLAVMTYELLAGRLPFTGAVAEVALKHLREEPPPPRSINPDIPKEIEQVILRALRKRPQDRWPSVMEYAHAYSEVLKKLSQRNQTAGNTDNEQTVRLPPTPPPGQVRNPAPQPPSAYETVAIPGSSPTPPQAPRPPQGHPASPYGPSGAMPPSASVPAPSAGAPGMPSWPPAPAPAWYSASAAPPQGTRQSPQKNRSAFPKAAVIALIAVIVFVALALVLLLARASKGSSDSPTPPPRHTGTVKVAPWPLDGSSVAVVSANQTASAGT
jgi:serine/threonine protein kinase